MSIEPRNLTAQIQHRASGNPPSTLPDSAVSNCFPGLEFDARNLWRRIFVGVEVHEASGLVTDTSADLSRLRNWTLVRVGGVRVRRRVEGPPRPGAALRFFSLEWSNALADVVAAGGPAECEFQNLGAVTPDPPTEIVELPVRPLFATGPDGETLPVIAEDVLEPGELTQSLCSPWQNDYRECACYYWAASRPDYVNVEPTADGSTTGTNWLARDRAPSGYTTDDALQFGYEELFRDWQGLLRFVVDGRDDD